jgi:hypothetical protein
VVAAWVYLPVPRVQQKSDTCWAASSTVVLGYYGKFPDSRIIDGGDTIYSIPNNGLDTQDIGLCEAVNVSNWVFNYSHADPTKACANYPNITNYWCKDLPGSLYRNCCDYWWGETGSGEDRTCTHGGNVGSLFAWGNLSYSDNNGAVSKTTINQKINTDKIPIPIFFSDPNHLVVIVASNNSNDDLCIHNGWNDSTGSFYCTTRSWLINSGGTFGTWSDSYIISTTPSSSNDIQIYMASSIPGGFNSGVTVLKQETSYIFDAQGLNRDMSVGPYVIETSTGQEVNFITDTRIIFNKGFKVKSGSSFNASHV